MNFDLTSLGQEILSSVTLMLNFMKERRVSALLVLMWNLRAVGMKGSLISFERVSVPGQLGEVHPEELVFYEHSGEHHFESDKIWTLGADNIEVHGVVHASHLQHLQV